MQLNTQFDPYHEKIPPISIIVRIWQGRIESQKKPKGGGCMLVSCREMMYASTQFSWEILFVLKSRISPSVNHLFFIWNSKYTRQIVGHDSLFDTQNLNTNNVDHHRHVLMYTWVHIRVVMIRCWMQGIGLL